MDLSRWFSSKGVLFIALFTVAVMIADQIKFSALWGAADQYFTLFQFMGPIAGGFLGPIGGVLSVLFAQIISFAYLGKEAELMNILRISPMLFAAYYFAKFGTVKELRGNYILLVPITAILLFITHPVGGQAWYYSLFWAIPVIAAIFFKDNLFARSLGATFTAHSVGGIIWLFVVPSTPALWIGLIPVVIYERFAFAIGISLSYIAFNTILQKVERKLPSEFIHIDRKYALFGNPPPQRMRAMRK